MSLDTDFERIFSEDYRDPREEKYSEENTTPPQVLSKQELEKKLRLLQRRFNCER